MLSTFSDDSVFNVVTGATGQAFVLINPNAGFDSKAVLYDTNYFEHLPYYYCSSASNTTPFAAI